MHIVMTLGESGENWDEHLRLTLKIYRNSARNVPSLEIAPIDEINNCL